MIEWQLLTQLHLREDAAEELRQREVDELNGLLQDMMERSEEHYMALCEMREMRDTLDENCRLLSDRLKECVKNNIIETSELSAAVESAIKSAEQLRAENVMKNKALARTRNEKALALEALVLKKKEAERARRVEKRVEGLYEGAVTALEQEQGAHAELNNSVLKVHHGVLKVFTSMEDFIRRKTNPHDST